MRIEGKVDMRARLTGRIGRARVAVKTIAATL
jgi:hypothetical protein